MSHPFQEGKTYRNRVGEYVVQSIDGDEMTIRYASGGSFKTRVSIQARIWENIQFEKQMAREEERRQLAQEARRAVRRRSARARKARAKPVFKGFQASDFEPKKRGIAWAGREQLGEFMAHELGTRTKGAFDSWIVPRKSGVHIARKDHYERSTRDRNAAFFVSTDEKGVTYGFLVGKPRGKMRAGWHISAFFAALADDGKPRRALRAAMKQHDLSLDVYAMEVSYGRVGQILVQDRGFLWKHETADQESTRRMTWQALVEYLEGIASNKQCELRLRGHRSVEEALEAGEDVSSQLADVFEALLPVYDVSVGV